jgi:hypothetical protein
MESIWYEKGVVDETKTCPECLLDFVRHPAMRNLVVVVVVVSYAE